MSADRDLAEAIYNEIISPESVDVALDNWRNCAHRGERERMWRALVGASYKATEAVLARRQREAARTGPWEAS
jgi:hypothetical protein